MNQPPLNQKAFEYAEEYCATYGEYSTFREQLRMGISAYRTVAHPLVTSLEELDAMPDGSIVMDSEGEVYIMTPYDEFWRVWGNDKRFSSGEIVLPVRVLHLPEVKP